MSAEPAVEPSGRSVVEPEPAVGRASARGSASADGAPADSEPADSEPGDGEEGTDHGPLAQLLIAWSPLSTILLAYWVAQWITAPLGVGDGESTNRLGIALDWDGLARVDEWVFGAVPTVWLQEHLVADATRWWDAAAALVYITHFISIPVLTAVVWFFLRERFGEWMVAVLTMSLVGIGIYLLHPAVPPWLAAQNGEIGRAERISHVGWEHLGLGWVGGLVEVGQQGSNPVAAMPSLHAAAALLVALFLWFSVGRLARALLLGYAVAMAWTLVYTAEHFVADIAAGWVVATLGVVVARLVTSRRGAAVTPRSAPAADERPEAAHPSRPAPTPEVSHEPHR